MDAIDRAINDNKQISFLYFDYDEKHKKVYRENGNRYVVNPAFMVWNKDNYYMLSFSNGHDNKQMIYSLLFDITFRRANNNNAKAGDV